MSPTGAATRTISTPVLLFPAPSRTPPPPAPLNEGAKRLVRALRRMARKSCLAPRTDCVVACIRTGAGDEPCVGAALKRFLDRCGRTVRVYPPEARESTADELWLLRLVEAELSGDGAAVAVLISFRTPFERRREARIALADVASAAAALAERDRKLMLFAAERRDKRSLRT